MPNEWDAYGAYWTRVKSGLRRVVYARSPLADDRPNVIRYEKGVPIYGRGTGDLSEPQCGEMNG